MHLANLVIVGGKSRGQTIPLGGNVIIGRRPDATLCLRDADISWNHARIEIYNDQLWIADLGSSNGTFVSGVRLSEHWTPLYPGSEVHFGKVAARIVEIAKAEPEEEGWPAIPDVAALNLDVPPVEPKEHFPLPRQTAPPGATTGRLRPFNPAYVPPPGKAFDLSSHEATILYKPTQKVPQMATPDRDRPRFYLTVPVHDLSAALQFYGKILGCPEGQSAADFVLIDFWGHHLKLYQSTEAGSGSEVDREGAAVRRFGLILPRGSWQELVRRLEASGVSFTIPPRTRFVAKAGKQAIMVFQDPSGNTLEISSSDNPDALLKP